MSEERSISESIIVPSRMVFIMWLLFYIQIQFEYDLGFLGIFPRELKGLPGIITAPVIHRSLQHVTANTIPILVLGTLLYFGYKKHANLVLFRTWVFTNILVWIFGRAAWHIGASGVVYGLAAFLIVSGFSFKDIRNLVIAAIVIILYSGLFQTLFLNLQGVSWEAHLMGVVVGASTAFELFILKRKRGKP